MLGSKESEANETGLPEGGNPTRINVGGYEGPSSRAESTTGGGVRSMFVRKTPTHWSRSIAQVHCLQDKAVR